MLRRFCWCGAVSYGQGNITIKFRCPLHKIWNKVLLTWFVSWPESELEAFVAARIFVVVAHTRGHRRAPRGVITELAIWSKDSKRWHVPGPRRGSLCGVLRSGGVSVKETPRQRPPYGYEWAVRILLECFLVAWGFIHTCDILGVNYCMSFSLQAIAKNEDTTHYWTFQSIKKLTK